jgi:hypothetical protein
MQNLTKEDHDFIRYSISTMADTVPDSHNNSNTAAVQATNDDASASKL